MFLRAATVSRKEKGESEGEEKNLLILFAIRSEDVGLEVIHREEVGSGGLRPEGVSATTGGSPKRRSSHNLVPTRLFHSLPSTSEVWDTPLKGPCLVLVIE